MAHGGTDKYYNPANKVVNDGDTAFADDLNDINYAVDTSLARVADDLDVMDVRVTTLSAEAEAWAHNDQGISPDPLEPTEFSSRAYAIESKEYAIQAEGVPIHKADGTTQLIDSAYVSATKAAASQAAALASKNAAALSETNAEAHSLQAWADQQVGFESMQDAQIAASAADASADLAASSAANLPNATTAGADKILTTNSTGDGWSYISKYALNGKNLLINGGFDVWQRGTSFTPGDYGISTCTADRWLYDPCSTATVTVSRQSLTPGSTSGLFTSLYFLRTTLAGTASGPQYFRQRIEGLHHFSGKTVTLSYYVKTSAASYGWTDPRLNMVYDTANHYVNGREVGVLPSSNMWQKRTKVFDIPEATHEALTSNSYLEVLFILGTRDATFSIDIANVQLEFGDTATDFEYRHPAEELALCQRYYERGSNGIPKVANMLSSDILRANAIPFKVTKRRVPVMTIGALTPSGHDGTPGTINATYPSTDEFCSQWNWTGGTAGLAVSAKFTWTDDAEI